MSLRCTALEYGFGVSNLTSYNTYAHPNAQHTICLEAGNCITYPTLVRLCNSDKKLRIHAGLDLFVRELKSFWVVENLTFSNNIRDYKFSRITLIKYLQRLTDGVEKIIAALVQYKFFLVFDGWSSSDTKHMKLFGMFLPVTENEYSKTLLALTTFQDEDDLGSDNHLQFAKYVF